MTSEFVNIKMRSMHCHWQRDQAAVYPT